MKTETSLAAETLYDFEAANANPPREPFLYPVGKKPMVFDYCRMPWRGVVVSLQMWRHPKFRIYGGIILIDKASFLFGMNPLPYIRIVKPLTRWK